MSKRLGGIVGFYSTYVRGKKLYFNDLSLNKSMTPVIWGHEKIAGGLCLVTHYSKSMDQPGKVASLARGQLNREN